MRPALSVGRAGASLGASAAARRSNERRAAAEAPRPDVDQGRRSTGAARSSLVVRSSSPWHRRDPLRHRYAPPAGAAGVSSARNAARCSGVPSTARLSPASNTSSGARLCWIASSRMQATINAPVCRRIAALAATVADQRTHPRPESSTRSPAFGGHAAAG